MGKHAVTASLSLAKLTQHDGLTFRPFFLSWRDLGLLNGWLTLYRTYTIFFIYLSAAEHLSGWQFLALVGSTTGNTDALEAQWNANFHSGVF